MTNATLIDTSNAVESMSQIYSTIDNLMVQIFYAREKFDQLADQKISETVKEGAWAFERIQKWHDFLQPMVSRSRSRAEKITVSGWSFQDNDDFGNRWWLPRGTSALLIDYQGEKIIGRGWLGLHVELVNPGLVIWVTNFWRKTNRWPAQWQIESLSLWTNYVIIIFIDKMNPTTAKS